MRYDANPLVYMSRKEYRLLKEAGADMRNARIHLTYSQQKKAQPEKRKPISLARTSIERKP